MAGFIFSIIMKEEKLMCSDVSHWLQEKNYGEDGIMLI